MFLLLVGRSLAAAPCPGASTAAEVEAALAAFATARAAASPAGMDAAVAAVRAQLRCLGEPLASEQVTRVHLLEAWAALGDRVRAQKAGSEDGITAAQARIDAATAAARRVGAAPGSWLPEAPAHPLRKAWDGADARLAAASSAPACSAAGYLADGVASGERNEAAAVLIQRVEADRVQRTAYAWPGDDLGDSCPVAARPPAERAGRVAEPVARRTELRLYVGGTGVGAGDPAHDTYSGGVKLSPGAFIGIGASGALGLAIPVSPAVRLLVDAAYLGSFASMSEAVEIERGHFGAGSIGVELGAGWARLALGPSALAGEARVGSDEIEATGAVFAGGGFLSPRARLFTGSVDGALELRGGLYTDGERAWYHGGLGLEIAL